MSEPDPKADLLRYLQDARDALLWKLDGLPEYDVRRPLTPTGTNLLGLVKHVAGVELGYFGDTFGRPFFDKAPPPPWWYTEEAEPNADMWATADESREEIVGLYRQAWEHSDSTIAALTLDAVGHVPWWPAERRKVTLHHILVRVISDTQRHAGHADIVRELIDGSAGLSQGKDSLPPGDRAWWEGHRSRLERVAREAGNR
ncbi:DinB family protein [Nonomuraea jabiensis]|uniref:Putative damage-inducible protein DinB n=1 Tax=Nonomuraea jabiensis TaxID=882448 RepID=A0A7W9GEV1_9ACTN|nr:DinB family protein [Nonomuraea jabiensis]MBB5782452.1 putative damage-inducible protein DinB [Nonomuraea jabiensis]